MVEGHRGRQDEGEEEQRDEEPELPHGERQHDDCADDERGEGGLLGCLRHGTLSIPGGGHSYPLYERVFARVD